MGNKQSKPTPEPVHDSLSALAEFADDQDPFKRAVITTLNTLVRERTKEQRQAAEKEKALTAQIADLDARNKSLSILTDLESGPFLQELFEIPPRGPRKKPNIKTVKTESRSSRNQSLGPTCHLTGSLAVLPTEVLEHILRLLHDEFHAHDRINALEGLADPTLAGHPQPWNPVGLQRVNRLFREIATPLFYEQIAVDSKRAQSATLLEMNYVASGQAHDLKESLYAVDLGLSDDDWPFDTSSSRKKKEKQAKAKAEGCQSEKDKARPVAKFRPAVKRLVIFFREEPSRANTSSFASSLSSLEENINDKYAFLRRGPGRKADRHRPLEEVVISTPGWALPTFEVAAKVTIIPRSISGSRSHSSALWYTGPVMFFNVVERGSKPAGRASMIEGGQRLEHVRLRLPKSTAADSETDQSRDLEGIRKEYQKFTYCTTVRLDMPFPVGGPKVVKAIEELLKSPALAAAKHFYDGRRQKVIFGVLSQAEADELRKRIDEFAVAGQVDTSIIIL